MKSKKIQIFLLALIATITIFATNVTASDDSVMNYETAKSIVYEHVAPSRIYFETPDGNEHFCHINQVHWKESENILAEEIFQQAILEFYKGSFEEVVITVNPRKKEVNCYAVTESSKCPKIKNIHLYY